MVEFIDWDQDHYTVRGTTEQFKKYFDGLDGVLKPGKRYELTCHRLGTSRRDYIKNALMLSLAMDCKGEWPFKKMRFDLE